MSVNVPNPGTYVLQLAQNFVNVRNDFQAILNANNYIASMGGTAFLTAAFPEGMGMTTADANALIAALGNHAALALVYAGGTPGAAFNYMTNGEPFWGGQ